MRLLPRGCEADLLYVALGDSTVEGVGATRKSNSYPKRLERRLRSVYPKTRLVNLGLGGAIAFTVLDFQLRRAIEMRPQLVTLSVGPNDVNAAVPARDFGAAMHRILDGLVRHTHAVVVVNLIPDMSLARRYRGAEKARVGRQALAFNDAIRAAAKSLDVEIVDLFSPSRALGAGYAELLSADGFHPSDLGYERWADFMWLGVERRVGCTAT